MLAEPPEHKTTVKGISETHQVRQHISHWAHPERLTNLHPPAGGTDLELGLQVRASHAKPWLPKLAVQAQGLDLSLASPKPSTTLISAMKKLFC